MIVLRHGLMRCFFKALFLAGLILSGLNLQAQTLDASSSIDEVKDETKSAEIKPAELKTVPKANSVDPWEASNRGVHAFNEGFDKYFMRPVTIGYTKVVPAPLRFGVTNFFSNSFELNSALNATLQGKPEAAGRSLGRFLLNITVGFFGAFDVATEIDFIQPKEDFGQTFAAWGIPQGPYIVLPFLGPSTVRDGVGLIPNLYVGAFSLGKETDALRYSRLALMFVDARAKLLESEALVSGDKYVFFRNAYIQSREFAIHDGKVNDDFSEEDLDDDWLDD